MISNARLSPDDGENDTGSKIRTLCDTGVSETYKQPWFDAYTYKGNEQQIVDRLGFRRQPGARLRAYEGRRRSLTRFALPIERSSELAGCTITRVMTPIYDLIDWTSSPATPSRRA